MTRSLDALTALESQADPVEPYIFVDMDFASGPARAWSGVGDFTLNGDVYMGVGNLGGISPIEEDRGGPARGIKLTLSHSSIEILAEALGETFQGRDVTVYMAFLQDREIVGSAFTAFGGLMDQMELSDGPEASILLTCESHALSDERTSISRYTDQEQKRRFSTDKGLEYIDQIPNANINWGVKGAPRPLKATGPLPTTFLLPFGGGSFTLPYSF